MRKMMKKTLVAIAALTLSGASLAEGPAWTYVDLGFVFTDSSGEDTSLGGALTGTYGIDMFHFNATYTLINDVTTGAASSDDYDSIRIGVGIHPAITENTDLVAELGWFKGGYDDLNAEPDGVDLTLGVRSMITDNFELNAAAILVYGSSDLCSDFFPPFLDNFASKFIHSSRLC